jgi:glycerate-2-kinase
LSEAIRRDAVTCALAGIAAVDPGDLVRRALTEQAIEGDVRVVAVGKAAAPMASATLKVLGHRIRGGVLISPDPVTIQSTIACYVGGHPVPNERGAEGAREIAGLARGLNVGDTLLCLISGGASSLMTLPPDGITVAEIATTTALLLRAGAAIGELNCVRKHLDRLKGGRLSALAFPARVVSLVLSDVVGDSLSTIASGPTVADPSTFVDAISVLESYDLWDRVPPSVREQLTASSDESPKPGDVRLESAASFVIGSNMTAVEAACAQARSLGYEARVVTTSLTGEASRAGTDIVRDLRTESRRAGSRVALIYGGETTVTVRGTGTGGRNQELVLGAAIAMDGTQGLAVASLGTDGVDGPTDAAGAVADGDSVRKAKAAGLDPMTSLANNDSHKFWKALGALVRTGPTGTNVMDIVVALAAPSSVPPTA